MRVVSHLMMSDDTGDGDWFPRGHDSTPMDRWLQVLWLAAFCVHSAKHHMGDSVKTASLGKWFPPWTVARAAWHMALKPKVSGISTDATLFSDHEAQLVHHYQVFGDCVAHASLCGLFMIDLLYFTNRACADAHRAAKRGRN